MPLTKKNFFPVLLGQIDFQYRPYSFRSKWTWGLFGLLMMAFAMCVLEWKTPFYFLQDDAYSTELPGLLYGCRNLLAGIWPEWNPHQYMGTPFASLGFVAITYPPTFLSYLFAKYILRNELFAMDVFDIAHLILGYIVTYVLLCRFALRPWIACMGGLCFSLSGIFLIGGRSWHALVTIALWMPILLLLLQNLFQNDTSRRWIILTGLSIACFYHAGFPQYWMYGVFFMMLATAIAYFTKTIKDNQLHAFIRAIVFSLIFIAPLFILQRDATADFVRDAGYGNGIGKGILAMLLPYPLVEAPHPEYFWGNVNREYLGTMYYAGTLFVLMFFISVLGFVYFIKEKKTWQQNIWLILGITAFLMALGKSAGIWQLWSALPIAGKMNNYPWRLLPFLNLFMVISGGIALERILLMFDSAKTNRWEKCLIAGTLALLASHVWFSQTSFYTYGDRPYPVIPEKMMRILSQYKQYGGYRFLSVAPLRSGCKGYFETLSLSMPNMLSDVNSFDGYDPISEKKLLFRHAFFQMKHHMFNAMQAYGVRYVIVAKPSMIDPKTYLPPPQIYLTYRKNLTFPLGLVFENANITMYEFSKANPMAFVKDHPEVALPVSFDAKGVTVLLRGNDKEPRDIVINVLALDHLNAYVDDKPVEKKLDKWGRVIVRGPSGAKTLTLLYQPPYSKALLAMLIMMIFYCLI